jgi:hypothetical protein
MPWVGLEPTISVFERAKIVHSLDRSGSVIGASIFMTGKKDGGGAFLRIAGTHPLNYTVSVPHPRWQ